MVERGRAGDTACPTKAETLTRLFSARLSLQSKMVFAEVAVSRPIMIDAVLAKVFEPKQREVGAMPPTVAAISALEPEAATSFDIDGQNNEFKESRPRRHPDDLLVEAFAVSASRKARAQHAPFRRPDRRHGSTRQIAEMKTANKTLVATLPCYLNAPPGRARRYGQRLRLAATQMDGRL